ncbi:MAG: ATP-binding protein, partial [Rhizonema sp. NSF051]|nr:ATP-binding protein [Rhizonema sp. NSF051]
EFNYDANYWQYDIAKVQTLYITDDVVEFLILQLEKLPSYTQEVLKTAACIGNQFDLQAVAIVHQKSMGDTAADLWTALVEGLILPEEDYNLLPKSNNSSLTVDSSLLTVNRQASTVFKHEATKYKFVHDRVQQATYALIPEYQKQSFHLNIGRLLLSNISLEEQEERIFDSVNQFNIAQELLTNQTERDELARMNLIAGRRAKASTAYTEALKYLTIGTQLLADDSWEKKYELTLTLYETAVEVAYLAGDFEHIEQFAQVVLAQAKTVLDKVKVYEVKIQAYGAQNKALEAVNIALPFLKLLGVEFPENPSQSDVERELEKTAANLADRRIEDLIDLPEMMEALPLAMMRILSSAMTFAYQSAPKLFPLILVQQINLSVQYGNAPLSAFGYVVYGFILCGVVGDIESGYQFGKLAQNLLSKFQNKEVTVKVLETFNQFIRPWKEHIRETLKPLQEVYSIGLEIGDLEFAAYALYTYSYTTLFMGKELAELEREIKTYSNAIWQIKQGRMFYWNEIYRQTVLNLLGRVDNPSHLIGEAYNEQNMLPLHFKSNDAIALLYLYFCKTHLCYLFADYTQALENAANAEKYLHGGIGKIVVPQFYFYDSLARLAIYCNAQDSEQKQILEKIYTNQEKMEKWAHHAPMNYLHKFYLVEAEKNRVLGNNMKAMELYDLALALAKEHEYINEEALANELAAKFYLEWGKPKIAQIYLTDAYYGYFRWGAKAKVDDLAKRYPQILSTIFQHERFNIHPQEKSISSNSTTISNFSNRQAVISSNTIISDSLDLAAVIKASQALSGQIELELLLSTLIEVVMENAGASKCALILREGDNLKLTVSAVSSASVTLSTEFPSIYISSSDVPVTLINYVKRTQEILVIDDARTDAFTANDRYIVTKQPKSLLCLPIINQSKLIGILYLENNLTTGAFTHDRVEVLKLLMTQAAICLENAILYNNLTEAKERLEEYSHTLEEKVTERTQELNEKNKRLQQALKDLQSTQTQLIQSEKMSSLGQMMAGIAHEINNPINFIHGNITHADNYIKDLLDLIEVYQQEYPDSLPLIQEKAEEIDLDFLVTDLKKLLDSMNVGSSRIRSIVLSLRNFSRLDEAEMKPVNIHEGIDNTLMILQHRLKTKSDRPEIEVIKEYGQLPNVACYAGQLNQVFMNILSNAIDALEQKVRNGQWGTGSRDSFITSIRICTEVADDHTVRIRIADNGSGMTAQVQEKIFDPFFTTKPVGSGTGLGLSISYQIIVDKHKGKLICNSTLGQGTEFVIEIPLHQL